MRADQLRPIRREFHRPHALMPDFNIADHRPVAGSPCPQAPILRPRDQVGTVRGKRQGGHRAAVRLQGSNQLGLPAGAGAPHQDLPIIQPGRDQVARRRIARRAPGPASRRIVRIGVHCHAVHFAFGLQIVEHGAVFDIPQAHIVIRPARGQQGAVGREGQGLHRAIVFVGFPQGAAVRRAEKLHSAIVCANRKAGPVRRKSQAVQQRPLVFQAHLLLAAFIIPAYQRAIEGAGDQLGAVMVHRQGGDPIGVLLQLGDQLAILGLPDVHGGIPVAGHQQSAIRGETHPVIAGLAIPHGVAFLQRIALVCSTYIIQNYLFVFRDRGQ